jgi:hypothetical protein
MEAGLPPPEDGGAALMPFLLAVRSETHASLQASLERRWDAYGRLPRSASAVAILGPEDMAAQAAAIQTAATRYATTTDDQRAPDLGSDLDSNMNHFAQSAHALFQE